MAERYLVVGLGVSGEAVAAALRARGAEVAIIEDVPSEASRARAERLPGIEVHEAPSRAELEAAVAAADVVVPSPGIPVRHPVFALARARGVPALGEVELGARWARCPLVAVTGTNGKTTVTTLVTQALVASGLRAQAAGNIGVPLVEAVERDLEVVVVEVSSFQLALTASFRPLVGVWLNVAEDHLDCHPTFDDYVAAKARLWANQAGDDLAVVNADDPVVRAAAATAPAMVTTFGVEAADAHWHVEGGSLRTPSGEEILPVAALSRALPHDLANALAAAAAATWAGGDLSGVQGALASFRSLPHRLTLVCDAGGVRWYDDSKATNPHAALAALRGFESAVLLAGGRNKGLDLSVLAEAGSRVRAVVAIGEAAPEVAAAFAGRVPVRRACSMDQAVAAAAELARPGDAVVLSPGCASFDWYRSYAERGDDFARAVGRLVGVPG